MKKLFYAVLAIVLGMSLNTASAQTATITFSEESFNVAKQYGGTDLQQIGQYEFRALIGPPAPCNGQILSEEKKQEYQEAANDCCCLTGICFYDGCGKYTMYIFFPETASGNCLEPHWQEPVNLPLEMQ